jgi:hypothetical protein
MQATSLGTRLSGLTIRNYKLGGRNLRCSIDSTVNTVHHGPTLPLFKLSINNQEHPTAHTKLTQMKPPTIFTTYMPKIRARIVQSV